MKPIPKRIASIKSMCGPQMRGAMHELGQRATRYLEIGVWRGGVFFQTIYDSRIERAVAIDNFSRFGGPAAFERHAEALRPILPPFRLIKKDCWEVDPLAIGGPFDLYFYDGRHQEEDQYRAVSRYMVALTPVATLVVDDWDGVQVRRGTLRAIKDCGIQILNKSVYDEHRTGKTDWKQFMVARIRVPNRTARGA